MIWIAAATAWEAAPLARRLGLTARGPLFRGAVAGRETALLELGMGAAAARGALDRAFETLPRPTWLLHTGFAGAVQPGVPAGTLIFDVWGEETEARDLAKRVAAERGLAYQLGRIGSADRVLTTPAEKTAFGKARRAVAVDLENEAVRDWAGARGIPFLAVKVVLDDLDQALPAEAPASPGASALVRYVADHWRDLPMLLRLWRLQRRTVRDLAAFLEAFAPLLPEPAGRP